LVRSELRRSLDAIYSGQAAELDVDWRRRIITGLEQDALTMGRIDAIDPHETFKGTVLDHYVGNVEDALRDYKGQRVDFRWLLGPTGALERRKVRRQTATRHGGMGQETRPGGNSREENDDRGRTNAHGRSPSVATITFTCP